MKPSPPSADARLVFDRIRLAGLGVLLLALLPWLAQDFVAGLATTEASAHARLRTTEEPDDARVLRAFQHARQRTRIAANLVTERNPQQQTRDALVTVTADTKAAAVADLETIENETRTNFAREGAGQLYLIDSHPVATPVPNGKSRLLRQVLRWAALVLLVGGLVLVCKAWRRSGLPAVALLGVAGTLATAAFYFLGDSAPGALWAFLFVAAVPTLLVVLLARATFKVLEAAHWSQTRARITSSRVEVIRHRFAGEATKVRNTAAVTYEFMVGNQKVTGDRISVGDAPADNVPVTLHRYPVGAEVPVLYDPADPAKCVLERDPPARLGRLWIGAIIFVVAYFAVAAMVWNGVAVGHWIERRLPSLHHPLPVLLLGLFGLLCLGSFFWNRRHPSVLRPTLATKGIVVASATETYLEQRTGSGSSQTRYYQAVIEYRYTVDGHEYHNLLPSSGGTEKHAAAEVAAHPIGEELEIHYDPVDPTRSSLTARGAITLSGRRSLVIGLISFAVAYYLARH